MLKIEDFKKYYNHTTDTYEFLEEDLMEIIEEVNGKSTPTFTENGIKILKCMQENEEKYMNIFKAKDIGEILFMAPRSVSGSMKKLINEGYAEKIGINPVAYGLTDAGKKYQFDNK